jgi:hypothetical protein
MSRSRRYIVRGKREPKGPPGRRGQVKQALAVEALLHGSSGDEWVEVMADSMEIRGLLLLASRLRRGVNPAVPYVHNR